MAEESQLSQEEIDQLLGGDSPGGGDQDAAADDLDLDSLLTDDPGGGGGGGDDSGVGGDLDRRWRHDGFISCRSRDCGSVGWRWSRRWRCLRQPRGAQ